jgi:hypothetical protein
MISARIKPTKAGWGLLLGAAAFTLAVAVLTARWALVYVDKGVQRMTMSVFILLLLALFGGAYGVGWLALRAKGIPVRRA